MEVNTPWPISDCPTRTVTPLSGAMTIQALISVPGASVAPYHGSTLARRAAWAGVGRWKPRIRLPPAAAVVTRNRRREISIFVICRPSLTRLAGGAVNGLADAGIRAATADVGHLGRDVRVG